MKILTTEDAVLAGYHKALSELFESQPIALGKTYWVYSSGKHEVQYELGIGNKIYNTSSFRKMVDYIQQLIAGKMAIQKTFDSIVGIDGKQRYELN